MTRLIGFRWKPREGLSREVLIYLHTFYSFLFSVGNRKLLTSLEIIVLVVFATGVHPIPFRTRQLSLSAPMVLRCDGGGE